MNMQFLNNLSIKIKILLMLIAPVGGLIYFSVNNVIVKTQIAAEMRSIAPLAELAVKVSALVHETQKERGATAGFLGSKGTKFSTELLAQRTETDTRLSELDTILQTFDKGTYSSEFNSQLNDALSQLSQLSDKRNAISAQSVSSSEAIAYYTRINGSFLATINTMTHLTENGEIVRAITAYENFLQGKERAGQERAVLSNVFANDTFAEGQLEKFSSLVTEQVTYSQVFMNLAENDVKQYYKKTMSDPSLDEVQRMRDIAFEALTYLNKRNFGVDPIHWFKTMTTKINLLKNVEDMLSGALITRVNSLQTAAQVSEYFYILLSLITSVLAIFLAVVIGSNISNALGRTLVALEDIAEGEGDLTRQLDDTGKDEIAQVAGAFNKFTQKIRGMVVQIKSSAVSIQNSSSEVSTGNINLSQRTQEQAASLEEFGSSMEEMTSTVNQNAGNASEANQLAISARDQAVKGNEVVDNAINAMKAITDSSKEIADIISVIDEIAFQTNLLALNAAVEAARAGEQGRGFAVVASEVRNLAGRSATAAKEIKALINDSVARVEDGSRLVGESGETLEEIVESVIKVSTIVQEIATASEEQSSGIEQANKAISEMDDMTQQNAALVEEAAAASQSMNSQANELASAVGFFIVDVSDAAAGISSSKPQQNLDTQVTVQLEHTPVVLDKPYDGDKGTDDSDWRTF